MPFRFISITNMGSSYVLEFLFMFMSVYLCGCLAYLCGSLKLSEQGIQSPESRVTAGVSPLTWVLGIELVSSERTACALNC